MIRFNNIFWIVVLALFGLAANAQLNPSNLAYMDVVCSQELANIKVKEPDLNTFLYIKSRLTKDGDAITQDLASVKNRVSNRDTDPDRGYFMLCVLSARTAMLQKPEIQAADVAKNWQSTLRPSLEASTGVKFSMVVQAQQASLPQAVAVQRVELPPREVASARNISGMPPLYEARPDPDRPGRHLAFAANGCALSFAQAAVRGLRWSGGCLDSRMHGTGTVLGLDYEKQPIFFFEGQIERGLRTQGIIYEFERRNGQFSGSRMPVVNGQLQQPIDIPFLDLPRPFLLALDDWQRQISGENFLASLGATWAPVLPLAKAGGSDSGAGASAAATCSRTYDACSTGCALGGVIGVLSSRGIGDTSAASRCLADCGSAQQQCLGGGARSATGSQAYGNSNTSTTVRIVSSDRVEIQATPHCGQYFKISDTPETRTALRKISFEIRNTCAFPVRIVWEALRNGQEMTGIAHGPYYSHLPRGGASRNVFYPPGAKVEIPPFGFDGKSFEVKIYSVCPAEEAATRIIGKPVKSVLGISKPGFCLVALDVPEPTVGVSR